jgi:hypothetical protein
MSKRDLLASGLVAVAGILYLLWVTDSALPGMDGPRATGIVVLALGFVASAIAVVPSFARLLHGSRIYLGVTSALGALAAAAGVWLLVARDEGALGVLIAAMVLLWGIATVHHTLLSRRTQ